MRATAIIMAAACGLTMLSASVQAGPAAVPGAAARPAITLAAGGCGPGFYPRTYRDRFGRLFTECVPNGPAYGPRRRCPPGWHWRSWVDRYGRVHGECVR